MVLEYLAHYMIQFSLLLIEIAPWMFLGFLIAAIIEEFIPSQAMTRYFGDNNLAALGRATLAGLFVSVCSCGAIPITASLRRKGASTATALTFLLATPWAGIPHLFIMMNFVGVINVLILFILALLVALCTGILLAFLENRQKIEGKLSKEEIIEVELCELPHFSEPLRRRLFYCVPRRIWILIKDVGKYILFGLLIAAFLAAFVPIFIIQLVFGGLGVAGIFSVLIAVPIAAVIELCAEGFTILAGQLYLMGASLAVVFTMTLIGVSTDFTELSMIWGKFGKRSAITYLIISTGLVILVAVGLVFIWPY